jgi:hypothetical protein
MARSQRQLWEAEAALGTEHTRPLCADPLLGRQGPCATGQRSRGRHHKAYADTGRVVTTTSGSLSRGSWITPHRNTWPPGLAVDHTRWSHTCAWTVRLATTHGVVASEVWQRTSCLGRCGARDASAPHGLETVPGLEKRAGRCAGRYRCGPPALQRAVPPSGNSVTTPKPAATPRTSSGGKTAPACVRARRCSAALLWSPGVLRRSTRTSGAAGCRRIRLPPPPPRQ